MTHKILIVDDEKSICEVLSAALKDEGYIVETAESGEISGQDVWASEVIGFVKHYCEEKQITLVVQHPPVKDTVKDALLKYYNVQTVAKGKPHAKDALRHLVSYLTQHKLIERRTK